MAGPEPGIATWLVAHAEGDLGERSVRNLQGEEALLPAARARLARLDDLARRGRARPGERARHATSRALPVDLPVTPNFRMVH